MSRIIDPKEQHARRLQREAAALPPVTEPPPMSAAQAFREWERVNEDRKQRIARGEGFQPLAKALPVPKGGVRVVVRSSRGVLHRGYRLNGEVVTHPRCHVTPTEVMPSGDEYDSENLTRPERMCRYPWCFRALLEEMGVDTIVGHHSRYLGRPPRGLGA